MVYFGPGGNSEAFKVAGLKSTVDAPRWLSEIGLDAYEYEAGNGLAANSATLTAIGREAKKYNISMSYHTPYFISLSGVVEEKRLKSIDYIKQSLDASKLLGAKTIVVHAGSAAKITRDEAMRLAGDTLARTIASVDTYGIKIGIETMGKINQLGTLDEVLELCRIDSAYVPVIDFGHLNARELGGFFMQPDVVDASVLKEAQACPENYQTLSVRVSGWNARFVSLCREWQEMVINNVEGQK